jgi:hypothetical protein
MLTRNTQNKEMNESFFYAGFSKSELEAEPMTDYINRIWHPMATIRRLIERDGLACHWCGKMCNPKLRPTADLFPTKEHLVRKRDGGTASMENQVIACRRCNNNRC